MFYYNFPKALIDLTLLSYFNLQREILLNILKFAQSKGQLGPHVGGQAPGSHLPNRGGGLSPLPGGPDSLAILQQQQQRLSPGLLGSGGLSVVSPTPNQRIPSPQELQVHTQQILQVTICSQIDLTNFL